ncbi:MAG: transglutaminase family protein [Acidimicrobiia bacterium]|nr:transglutaminase family protein [Acidimicrobiia bacterium]
MSIPAGPDPAARYRIEHLTRFGYDSPVRRCTMSLCLRPLEGAGQQLLGFGITTTPPGRLTTETDPFGNTRHVLTVNQKHDSLEVGSVSTVEVSPSPPLPQRLEPEAWEAVRSWTTDLALWQFTQPSPGTGPTPALSEFVSEVGVEPGSDPLTDLVELASTLNDTFDYVSGSTSVDSPIDEILTTRRGVCQDYAHVMIAIARSWGVPTRYVSGYLHTDDPADGANGPTSTATHAWVECRLPELGWVEFDPTNRTLVDHRYVRTAVGRDYRDVPPTRGVVEGGANTGLDVRVRVIRLAGAAPP